MPDLSVVREFSAERINAVLNHSEVRPHVGGVGPLDVSGLVSDLGNVLLMGQGGGLLFQRLGDGYYEVHTQFLPEHRGEAALKAVNDALWWMFTKTDATEIVTKVPDGNVSAYALVRSIHGTPLFHRPNVWPLPDGTLTGIKYYSKTLAEWVRTADGLVERGEWFHGKLEAAKNEAGATSPIHDDDDAHDRYVGATVAMIQGGQFVKAIHFYNRWSVLSGYATVSIIADNPVVIDIRDALIAVRGEDFEVILCR